MSEQAQVEMRAFAKNSPSPGPVPVTRIEPCSEKRLRNAELGLRFGASVAAVVAFVFLLTDKQSRSFTVFQAVITQDARFSDVKALVFSVISLGIVAVYSMSQAVRCLLGLYSGGSFSTASVSWTIFLLDQVMTYVILSSSAASAQSAWFSEQGNDGLHWAKVCYLYEHFCSQVGAGIIGSYIVFLTLVFTSGISAYNLFRSHGPEC